MNPYPRPQHLAYPARALSSEGSLSRGRSFGGQSESWPDRGAPERSTELVAKGGAPGGAAPYVTGRARFTLPREAGPVIPPPRVPRKHSGASRRSIALAHFARDWQTSDALRRENAEAWLFEIVDQK